jgi:superfamily II DNA or RNA helicase
MSVTVEVVMKTVHGVKFWNTTAVQRRSDLTATPKETTDHSTEEYFGKPVYTYSLKQGIDDGFLAPYKVIRYRFNNDEWRPVTRIR